MNETTRTEQVITHPMLASGKVPHLRRLKHQKSSLIVIFIISIISVGIFLVFWGLPAIGDGLRAEALASYDIEGIRLVPGYDGEMWLEANQIHFVGWLIINDTLGRYEQMVFSSQTYQFDEENLAAVHSSNYNTGPINARFINGSLQTPEITLYVESDAVWIVPWRNSAFTLLGLSLILITWLIIPYLAIISPLRNAKARARFNAKGIEPYTAVKKEDLPDLMDITNEVRGNLQGEFDRIQSKMMRLLNFSALVIVSLIALFMILIQLPLDAQFKGIVGLIIILAIGLFLSPLNKLIAPITTRSRPSTLHTHEGNISSGFADVDTFDADLLRYSAKVSYYTIKDLYRDNLMEIMHLYYLLKLAELKYDDAVSGLRFPFYLGGVSFVAWFFTFFISGEIIGIGLFFLLGILLTLVTANAYYSWYREDFILTRYILFHSPKDIDQSLPCNDGFDDVESMLIPKGITPVITAEFTPGQFEEISHQVKISLMNSGLDPDKADIYGGNPGDFGWCGKKVPILAVVKTKENDNIDIYPKRDSKNELVTIRNYVSFLEDLPDE